MELPSLCRVSTRGWTSSAGISALGRAAGRMRAEERLDEKTRKKTRLRREGIFGPGFVASRRRLSQISLRPRPCRKELEKKKQRMRDGGKKRLCREERGERREQGRGTKVKEDRIKVRTKPSGSVLKQITSKATCL